MHIIKQVEDLSMGWCLDCHRESLVHPGSNEYYKALFAQRNKFDRMDISQLNVEELGGNDCQKCHY